MFNFQITLDLSRPHQGYVHDGIKGDHEVNFQQGAQLNAHWEGFYDLESGIDFYQYVFSDKCFNETEMAVSSEVLYLKSDTSVLSNILTF